ncbi:MAG: amidohydrolase [Sedimentisphaerales bacterium]|nr:amidohydrolase [Sedimentisphaerales bacterium]
MHNAYKLISRQVDGRLESITTLRRKLHEIPESAFEEHKTAELIAGELRKIGLDIKTGVASTGIVGDLDTGRDGYYVALRADMDGLPIRETTGRNYCSQHPDFAHSCGHDGHVASLIGTAQVLKSLEDKLMGRVRFVFQPAEESGHGARVMIDDGCLGETMPDAIFSLHGWPNMPVDLIGSRPGVIQASCDMMTIKVIGKGGHGAQPRQTNNPMAGMARCIDVLSRMNNSQRVVSLCTAHIGTRPNVVADEGELTGSLRALADDVREDTMAEIRALVDQECCNLGMQAQITFGDHTPVVKNDEKLYTLFRKVGADMLGPDKVMEFESPSMGSEDFGYYLQHIPGLLFRVGMGLGSAKLHQSDFDFNDQALRNGMLIMAGMTEKICREGVPA